MRSISRNCQTLVIGILAFFVVSNLGMTAEIHLSPTGTISTVEAARDAARQSSKPVTIVVQQGVYALQQPLSLDDRDSQTTWKATPGATPVFSGGQKIVGWKKVDQNLWSASIKDHAWIFEQLWINGRLASRARTPNKGFWHLAGSVREGIFDDLRERLQFGGFEISPEHFAAINAIPPKERRQVILTVMHAWAVSQCRIQALNEDSNAIRIVGTSNYPFVDYEPDQRFWLENYRAALDAPGEWYLDSDRGELLYWPLPGESMERAEVVAPYSQQLLTVKNAQEIRFNGISFQHSRYLYPEMGLHDRQAAVGIGGAIEIAESRAIDFVNCEVARVGRYGIYYLNGCADSHIEKCHFHNLGGGGVRVGESNRPEDRRVCSNIVIDNCIINKGGRLHPSACGVFLTHTKDCVLSHCDISDLYYSGVSAGWHWGYGDTSSSGTLVENNHIHHLGWAYLSDMGGFYGLGTSPGTTVRGNHVHHIASFRYGGWGLYNDEGSSTVLMENNLVHDTSNSGFHQHYGYYNIVRNNIFAFGETAQIQRSRFEPRLSFKFEHNIVVWDPSSPLLDGGEWNWKLHDNRDKGEPKDTVVFKDNLYWRTDGQIPEFLTRTVYTWDQWKKMGRDAGSLFANPMFVNLDARDFRLKSGSPSQKIGFQPWDLSIAGVRKEDPDWLAQAKKLEDYPTWDKDAKPWLAPAYEIALQTFENVPAGSIGIRHGQFNGLKDPASSGVTDKQSSPIPLKNSRGKGSAKSLKVQDSEGLPQSYYPILDIYPTWESGRFLVSFDVMGEKGADWFFEMRGKPGEYAAGPLISWKKDVLSANVKSPVNLAKVPAGDWCRVTVTATTGQGKYDVDVTLQDGSTKSFKDLPCSKTWSNGGYLLFSATANADVSFYIDNLVLKKIGGDK